MRADNPIDPFANDGYNFLSWGGFLAAEWRIDNDTWSNKVLRAEAALVKQRAEADALTQKLRLDVVQQFGEVDRRARELDVRRVATKAAKGWLVSNSLNFGLGLVTTDELLKSLVAYSQARLTYFRTIYEHNLAVAKLSQMVGTELAVPPPRE